VSNSITISISITITY